MKTIDSKIQESLKPTNRIEFTTLAGANHYAENCIKIHMVVLGDNGKYWVMLPKFSERLVKSGYEYAQ